MSKNIATVQAYFNALATGDLNTAESLLAADIVWHQPGKGIQSGDYKGKNDLFTLLGNFAVWSNGTFAIDKVDYITDNGDLVVASIHFTARKEQHFISMKGVDLLKVEDGRINEVWLFSENIDEEDNFWNAVSQ